MSARLSGPRAYAAALGGGVKRVALEEWRALPVYKRLRLRAATPSALQYQPKRFREGDPETGAAILQGRFALAGAEKDVGPGGDPWDDTCPSRLFAERLHAFAWLPDLLAVEGTTAQNEARRLVDRWIEEFGQKVSVFSWEPGIAAQRLRNWIAAASSLFADKDAVKRSRRFSALATQARHVARSAGEAPDGLPRLLARAAALEGALCLGWPEAQQDKLLRKLDRELDRQVRDDGIHASRSPEATLEVTLALLALESLYSQANKDAPEEIASALDRLGPAVKFFRHADGRLAGFNGGGESAKTLVTAALAREPRRKRAFNAAPQGKFLRGATKDSVLLMDGGASPPVSMSAEAHGGALAFEFSTHGQRLIVNCGWAEGQPEEWREPVRGSAAHSTLTLEETSTSRLVPPGPGRRILGPRLKRGSQSLAAQARAEEEGLWLDAAHDGYVEEFGLIHRRRLYLAGDGLDLRGEDTLDSPVPGKFEQTGEPLHYAVRFHLPPGVRSSLSRDGASVLLAPQKGPGWRFRTDAPPIQIERSAYLSAGAPPRRAEQLVIYGIVPHKAEKNQPLVCVRWALQQTTEENS